MSINGLLYKSATPLKLNCSTKAGTKKSFFFPPFLFYPLCIFFCKEDKRENRIADILIFSFFSFQIFPHFYSRFGSRCQIGIKREAGVIPALSP